MQFLLYSYAVGGRRDMRHPVLLCLNLVMLQQDKPMYIAHVNPMQLNKLLLIILSSLRDYTRGHKHLVWDFFMNSQWHGTLSMAKCLPNQ